MSLEKYQKKAKGTRPIKKSIGWTDMTCNPIKGKCQGDCWYCWTKSFYKRGFLKKEIRLDLSVFNKLPKKTLRKIFLCSTHDLFGDWIPGIWRDLIFKMMGQHSHHTFQILTKFPQNIDRPMPDNVWLGVSVTGNSDFHRVRTLQRIKPRAKVNFVSMEPLLSKIWHEQCYIEGELHEKTDLMDWLIVGKLTQYGNKYDPKREWIEHIAKSSQYFQIPIFMKDNLRSIWGEGKLIQELPK